MNHSLCSGLFQTPFTALILRCIDAKPDAFKFCRKILSQSQKEQFLAVALGFSQKQS
jgi:hypothetical protein